MAKMAYDQQIHAYSIVPPLFSQFRRANGKVDSDREGDVASLSGADGFSDNIAQSAKQHLLADIFHA